MFSSNLALLPAGRDERSIQSEETARRHNRVKVAVAADHRRQFLSGFVNPLSGSKSKNRDFEPV